MNALQTIEHKGHEINIYQDTEAPNPWEHWDGVPPIMFQAERRVIDYGNLEDTLKDILYAKKLTQADISTMLDWLGMTKEDAEYEADGYDLGEYLVDQIIDNWDSHHLEDLAEIANFLDIPCKTGTAVLYHNGAGVDYLIALTPEWYKITGCKKENAARDLAETAQLFSDWINGNVYGYEVEGPLCDHTVWGFYGDPETSGLIDDAKSAIDHAVKKHHQDHQHRVKQLIKNHVPLRYRAEAIA